MTTKWIANLLCAAAFTGATLTSALPVSAQQQAPDNNGPGPVRVTTIDGSAVVTRGDDKTQVAAVINAPLLPGDYISTGPTSRVELQFDSYTAVRLGGSVQARITNNDPNNHQLQLADGTIEFAVVHGDTPMQVDTPSVTVRSADSGNYRITISRDGSTWVTARHGRVEVVTPHQTYTLTPGRTLVARGSASSPSIAYTTEVGYDSFDEFNTKRDEVMVAAINADTALNPSIAGYGNVSSYGSWQNVAPSGYGGYGYPGYAYGCSGYPGGYGYPGYAYGGYGYAGYGYGGYGCGSFGIGWFGISIGFGSGCPGIGWLPYAPYYPLYSGWIGYGWGYPYGYGYGGYGYGGYGGYGYGGYGGVTHITNIYNNYYPRRGGGHGSLVGNVHNGNSGHIAAVDPSRGGHGSLGGNVHSGNFGHIAAVDPMRGTHAGVINGKVPEAPGKGKLAFSDPNHKAPVTRSKVLSQPRLASHHAVATGTRLAEHQRAVSHAIHATGRENVAIRHQNAPNERLGKAPNTRTEAGTAVRGSQMALRENRTTQLTGHENAQNERLGNAPSTHTETGAAMRGTETTPRENGTAVRGTEIAPLKNETAVRASAPTDPWQRFDQSRGPEVRNGSVAGSRADISSTGRSDAGLQRTGENVRATSANDNARNVQAANDPWSRFSQQRGNVAPRTDAYSSARNEANGRGYGEYNQAYNRGEQSYPSNARGNESYPSYPRGNESYPSYPRGNESYPSYPRGNESYPSYPRGSYGSYPSAPRSSAPSAPRSSGGGGGGGGGGYARGGGGGRPPH